MLHLLRFYYEKNIFLYKETNKKVFNFFCNIRNISFFLYFIFITPKGFPSIILSRSAASIIFFIFFS